MNTTVITVRTASETHLIERQADYFTAGFEPSNIGNEVGSTMDRPVFILTVEVDDDQAHLLPRGDDRWKVANSFFQRANYERRLIGRDTGALLAADWSSFGYAKHTLESYLQRELDAQVARRAALVGAR